MEGRENRQWCFRIQLSRYSVGVKVFQCLTAQLGFKYFGFPHLLFIGRQGEMNEGDLTNKPRLEVNQLTWQCWDCRQPCQPT